MHLPSHCHRHTSANPNQHRRQATHLGDTPLHLAAQLQVLASSHHPHTRTLLSNQLRHVRLTAVDRRTLQDADAATVCLRLLVEAGASFDALNNA